MRTVFHIALLGMLLWPACAEAKKYTGLGAGGRACEAWTKARTEDPDGTNGIAAGQWVMGFVTGYNVFGPGSGNLTLGMENTEILLTIDTYCKQNPDETIAKAATEFVANRRNP